MLNNQRVDGFLDPFRGVKSTSLFFSHVRPRQRLPTPGQCTGKAAASGTGPKYCGNAAGPSGRLPTTTGDGVLYHREKIIYYIYGVNFILVISVFSINDNAIGENRLKPQQEMRKMNEQS